MAISKTDLSAFRRVMSHYGKLAAGVPKTLSPAALAQRKAAGKASALARGLARKKKPRKAVPTSLKKGLARTKRKKST